MPCFTIIYNTNCGWRYGAHRALLALAESGAQVRALHRYLFQRANAHRMADGFGAQAARLGSDALAQQAADRATVAAKLMDRMGLRSVPSLIRSDGLGWQPVDLSTYYQSPSEIARPAS